jgi:Flp pilus assembly protein TadD
MSFRQFVIVVAVLVCLEVAVFDWRFHDLVYLTRPVTVLAHESVERFVPQAEHALSRPTLTRARLETIAQTARTRNDHGLAIRALARLAQEYPSDGSVHLRLADALREVGRIEEAEQAYRQAIAATERGRR